MTVPVLSDGSNVCVRRGSSPLPAALEVNLGVVGTAGPAGKRSRSRSIEDLEVHVAKCAKVEVVADAVDSTALPSAAVPAPSSTVVASNALYSGVAADGGSGAAVPPPASVPATYVWPWGSPSGEPLPTRTLEMPYWVRTPECKELKALHLEYIDRVYSSREQFIVDTVFTDPLTGVEQDTVLEPNMFPYDTPPDIEHWTLWAKEDMTEQQVEEFVTNWLVENKPFVTHWNYDDNAGERSILWFHVHVYFQVNEMKYARPRLCVDSSAYSTYSTCSSSSVSRSGSMSSNTTFVSRSASCVSTSTRSTSMMSSYTSKSSSSYSRHKSHSRARASHRHRDGGHSSRSKGSSHRRGAKYDDKRRAERSGHCERREHKRGPGQ